MSANITFIGIGSAGKNIVDNFRGYKQYEVFSVDSEGDADIHIDEQDSHEDYEKEYGSIIPVSTNKIIFVLSGSGDISGAALSLLEPYRDKEINIYYIEPDRDFLSSTEKKKERIVRNVFTQMTRSAVFERMFFANNSKIEEIYGGIPIKQYFEEINEVISYTLNNFLYFQNNEAVFGDIQGPDDICRLSSMGVINDENGKEEYFYDLGMIKEKEFYFTFESDELENNRSLVRDLKNRMSNKREGEMQIDISYSIFEMKNSNHICVSNTSVDQSIVKQAKTEEE